VVGPLCHIFTLGECMIECFNISRNYTPYKIFLNDSNGHDFYFLKYYYYNIWIIHVQSPTNLPKSMQELVFNGVDAFF